MKYKVFAGKIGFVGSALLAACHSDIEVTTTGGSSTTQATAITSSSGSLSTGDSTGPGSSSTSSAASTTASGGDTTPGTTSDTGLMVCGAEQDLESWPTEGFLLSYTANTNHAHLWITRASTVDYIDRWLTRPAASLLGIPGGPIELDGTFNPGFSYRMIPSEVAFGEVWTEVCDATPCFVEMDAPGWISDTGDWCPWSFQVDTVYDCRGGDGSLCEVVYP